MASVSIANIQSGMTLGRTFVAYGEFDITMAFYSTAGKVNCTITVNGSSVSPVDYQESFDSTGMHGYWQASFQNVPTGNNAVLSAALVVPSPPTPAQATNLTISDAVMTLDPPTAPPPPPPPPPSGGPAKVVAKKKGPNHTVKPTFTVGGTYTPGPADIVIVFMRKAGTFRGDSKVHRLTPGTKKWEDDVAANLGELGQDYVIIAELQHNAKKIATAALIGVEIKN